MTPLNEALSDRLRNVQQGVNSRDRKVKPQRYVGQGLEPVPHVELPALRERCKSPLPSVSRARDTSSPSFSPFWFWLLKYFDLRSAFARAELVSLDNLRGSTDAGL